MALSTHEPFRWWSDGSGFNRAEFSEPLLCCFGFVLHSSAASLGSCGVLHSGLPSSHCLSSARHFPAFRDSFPWATDQHVGILPEFYSPIMRGLSLGQSHPHPHPHTHILWIAEAPFLGPSERRSFCWTFSSCITTQLCYWSSHSGQDRQKRGEIGKPLPHVATSSTIHHLDLTLQSPQEFAFCVLPRGFGCSRQKTEAVWGLLHLGQNQNSHFLLSGLNKRHSWQ